jgi:hypothetical protein
LLGVVGNGGTDELAPPGTDRTGEITEEIGP